LLSHDDYKQKKLIYSFTVSTTTSNTLNEDSSDD